MKGECRFVVHFGDIALSVQALITDVLDNFDVLAGTPFGMVNEVTVQMKYQKIWIQGKAYPYGAKPPAPMHNIRRLESVILRNDNSKGSVSW